MKEPGRIKVIHFQRKARPGFNFSIESIFENIRNSLKETVDFSVVTSSRFNDGYISKLLNIVEAGLRQKKNTVIHITGEVHFLNLLMRRKNVLLTIHDCRFMERKTGRAKKMLQWLYLKAPVKKAAFVTTVSETTKNEIISYTGCEAEKIKVIPPAVNAVFKPAPKIFNKTCPVILQLKASENKNLPRLIEAIKNIPCHLVIIGEVNSSDIDKLEQHTISYTIKSNLSTAALYEEYIKCDILAFVSTAEGFGLPIIEANCVERPVLTSNISSMPEVSGDAGCLVDPYDINAIRNGLLKIINDDAYRETLIANGRKNRQRFSAEVVADTYYRLYKKIATGQ